jgi:amino acid transporter
VPTRAVYLVAGLTLVLGVTLVDQLELFTSMVSFGALLGFLTLQVSVVAYFVVRKRSRNWGRHLITPAIAFAIVGYVLWNAEANAKIAGAAWMALGVVVYVLRRLTKRRVQNSDGGAL